MAGLNTKQRQLLDELTLRHNLRVAEEEPPRPREVRRAAPPAPTGAAVLSLRELEVLTAMADGLTNEEIGVRLTIAAETVKSHAKKIIAKLEARNRTHAVSLGFQQGLLDT